MVPPHSEGVEERDGEPGHARGEPPPHLHRPPGRTRGIAEARAGSRHPLSESRPQGQEHSVAEEDDPHGTTKVSSGESAAEEEGDTISRGRRGSKHPLSESRS